MESTRKGLSRRSQLEQRALKQVSVPIIVELGQCEVAMRDVLNLEVGDIVKLDSQVGEELVLCIGSLPKFRCVPGAEGKSLAVQITRLISPEEVP
jgi:flagellar motor switch protein FliM